MRVAATAIAIAIFLGATPAAHALAEHLKQPGALSPWDFLAIVLLLAIAVLYVSGSLRVAARGAVHPRRERICFWAGWATLLVCILPPLDALALQTFSAHMAQHELMMLLGAPLLIGVRPLSTCLWGFTASPPR